MKPDTPVPAASIKRPRVAEVYCRRDNRVVPACPHVTAGSQCRCMTELETADALFDDDGSFRPGGG